MVSSFNLEQLEDRLVPYVLSSHVWSQPSQITYSFSNLTDGGMHGISSTKLIQGIKLALNQWEKAAPLHFIEVPDTGPPTEVKPYDGTGLPMIRFGHTHYDGPLGKAVAFAFYPDNNLTNGLAGDVFFDNDELWSYLSGGSEIGFVEIATHEIGHALGLSHEPNIRAVMNPNHVQYMTSLASIRLLPDDIAGIQAIYGARQESPISLILPDKKSVTVDAGLIHISDGSIINPFVGYTGHLSVTTDGITSLTVTANNGHIKVFDINTKVELSSFFSYVGYEGAIWTGVKDFTKDGISDIVTITNVAGHVKVFDGVSGNEVSSYFVYENYLGIVNVIIDAGNIITTAALNNHTKTIS